MRPCLSESLGTLSTQAPDKEKYDLVGLLVIILEALCVGSIGSILDHNVTTPSIVGLLSRILKSLIKVGYPSRFKSFLSDF